MGSNPIKIVFLIQFVKVKEAMQVSNLRPLQHCGTPQPLQRIEFVGQITSNILYNQNLGDAVAPAGH